VFERYTSGNRLAHNAPGGLEELDRNGHILDVETMNKILSFIHD
jgi:hypothetical protein